MNQPASCAVLLGFAAWLLTASGPSAGPAPVQQPRSGVNSTLGALEGTVRLNPPLAPRPSRVENTTDPAVCGRAHTLEDLMVSRDGAVASAIVALDDVPADRWPPAAPTRLTLDNRQCRFVPHVAVLTTGGVVTMLNSDAVLHTVHLYGPREANAAAAAHAVDGTVDVDVNERQNTGRFVARLRIPEGNLDLSIDRFNQFSPCQDGGIAAYIYEHGDSGCGATNWPKTFIYVAGWGYGNATLNGQPLYRDYEMHFMVTQGIRDRQTLRVNYPLPTKRSAAGEVNPAAQQLDFYIRSPETQQGNNPPRRVFAHFFAMEVTWK